MGEQGVSAGAMCVCGCLLTYAEGQSIRVKELSSDPNDYSQSAKNSSSMPSRPLPSDPVFFMSLPLSRHGFLQ
jgi:hypothetical protein